jgi:signal transduction histidine kinase
MRRLLGMLRSPSAGTPEPELTPVPGTSQLSALLEQTRTAGVPVTFRQEGTPAAGPADGADLAVYRVVQESLTNVRRHGGPGVSAAVTIRYTVDGVTVSVTDDGRGAAARPAPASSTAADSTGHGLSGMRERVELYGGTVTAGPRSGGGYQVTATLPLTAAQLTRGAA